MIHAALVVAAVTAGVGTAVAFEFGVFRPWREVNWPNGIAEGIKQEWEELSENVKQGIRETSGDFRRQRENWQRQRDQQQQPGGNGSSSSELEEEMQLRREMDEFSQHEAQVSGMRKRLASEFDEGAAAAPRRRHLQGQSWQDSGEDMRAIDLPLIHQQRPSISGPTHDGNPFADSLLDRSEPLSQTNNTDSPASEHYRADEPQVSTRADSISGLDTSQRGVSSTSDSWQSPLSSPNSHTIQDDWQSQLSPGSHATAHRDESDGEAWVQLTDSRSSTPLSPLSPSWDTNELSRELR